MTNVPTAPANVTEWATEWLDLKVEVDDMAANKKDEAKRLETAMASEEKKVMHFLETTNPVEKRREVSLIVHGVPISYMLSKEEEKVEKIAVRIKAFTPYMQTSLQAVAQSHPREMMDFSAACTDSIKAELIVRLQRQFAQCQADKGKETQEARQYVSMNKVRRTKKD